MKISPRQLTSLIRKVVSSAVHAKRESDIIAKADDMMTSAWNSDADELHFRSHLEMIAKSIKSNSATVTSIIDNIINKMRDCSHIDADLRNAIDDELEQEYIDQLNDEFARKQISVYKLIRRFFRLVETLSQ